jgi:hypothetical protein
MKLNWSHENFKVLGIDFSLDLNCITDVNFTKKNKEVNLVKMSVNELALVVQEFLLLILPSNVSFLCCQLFSIAN